ncbi:MAG TPA: TIGR01777 family oxidoreductase [Cyclobacteriaceae bacterium]|jgi:uncharacterized protein (TIGR01777 family)|nr:TIGR01777 family oxidoreductase [Cyclobacteriaceae bacterium]
MSKRILITGASGLIGSALSESLSKNHSVVHLGRTRKPGNTSFVWDVKEKRVDERALFGVDAVVHLAGASVGEKRWTAAWKKEILDSRVQSTRLLYDTLKKAASSSVKTFIAASAIGYYGFESDSVFDEESKSGNDFLAQVTKQWEDEVDKIKSLGIRVVKIRVGIVLSKNGGALEKMATPIKYGVGSPLGSGKQYLSWIHLHDLCGIFSKAIEDENLRGAYNATSNWTTNKNMTETIANVLQKPLWLPPVPGFVLKLILGEMAKIVLNGSKVSSLKIRQAGYHFKYLDLEAALTDLLC